jgi:hypothetical protein
MPCSVSKNTFESAKRSAPNAECIAHPSGRCVLTSASTVSEWSAFEYCNLISLKFLFLCSLVQFCLRIPTCKKLFRWNCILMLSRSCRCVVSWPRDNRTAGAHAHAYVHGIHHFDNWTIGKHHVCKSGHVCVFVCCHLSDSWFSHKFAGSVTHERVWINLPRKYKFRFVSRITLILQIAFVSAVLTKLCAG